MRQRLFHGHSPAPPRPAYPQTSSPTLSVKLSTNVSNLATTNIPHLQQNLSRTLSTGMKAPSLNNHYALYRVPRLQPTRPSPVPLLSLKAPLTPTFPLQLFHPLSCGSWVKFRGGRLRPRHPVSNNRQAAGIGVDEHCFLISHFQMLFACTGDL